MLPLDQTLLYLPAVAIIIAIPGPDMLLSLSRGLTQGPAAGLAHAFGVGLRIMAHSLLAALGVSTLLTASETAFWAMKLIGGYYLIYLGIQSWRNASAVASVTSQKAPWMTLFWRGFMSNLLNPKVALFVLAFVPQFVRSSDVGASSLFVQMLLLGAIFSLLTLIAYGALGVAAGGVSRWLAAHPSYLRNVNPGECRAVHRVRCGGFIIGSSTLVLSVTTFLLKRPMCLG